MKNSEENDGISQRVCLHRESTTSSVYSIAVLKHRWFWQLWCNGNEWCIGILHGNKKHWCFSKVNKELWMNVHFNKIRRVNVRFYKDGQVCARWRQRIWNNEKICFAALPNPWFIVGLWFEQQTSCAALENLFNIDDTHLRDSSELTLKDRHTGWRVFWLSEQGKSEKEWQCQRLLCIINHSNVTSSLLRMIHPWWLRWFCWCWKRDKSGTSEHCSLPAH